MFRRTVWELLLCWILCIFVGSVDARLTFRGSQVAQKSDGTVQSLLFSSSLRRLEDYWDYDDDASFVDDEGNWQQEQDEKRRNDDDKVDDDDYQYAHQAANTAGNMWTTAPHDWSPTQWAFFSMFLSLISFLCCCWCLICVIPRCCGQRGTMMYSAMLT